MYIKNTELKFFLGVYIILSWNLFEVLGTIITEPDDYFFSVIENTFKYFFVK